MDLIRQLRQTRDKINDIRADYKWLQNGKLIGTFQWGWKQGKEFLISPYLQPDCSLSYRSTDGQMEYAYNQHKKPVEIRQLSRSFEFTGSVFKKQNPSFFKMHQTPKHLLGDYVIDNVSFSECLKRAESLTIRPETEEVNGMPCIVLEARKILIEGRILRSLLVWLDPDRDYLPVKLESYDHQNIDSPQETTDTPYENGCLHLRQDTVILDQFNGVWFPVSGDYQAFSLKAYLPDGRCLNDLTEEEGRELEKTLTQEELLEQVTYTHEQYVMHRLEVESVIINQGIEDDEFRIQFPPGCAVHDAFKKQFYVIGETSEQEMSYSSDDWLEQVKKLSFDELIEFLNNWKLGASTQNSIAAIKTLIERKPSVLPQICDLLSKTDNANLQSILAFIIRAIGSKDAVPALINALAKCGHSSDYGLGMVVTPLDEYYHNLQIDPTDTDLKLGRPVREITFALEKITGHTEGHDHFNFYFYDQDGKHLGSVEMTDELKERIHERNRQVVQQWRTWWNQQ